MAGALGNGEREKQEKDNAEAQRTQRSAEEEGRREIQEKRVRDGGS